ncbi:MAG: Gfo/Idh/MocA family oxidoreductase [Actinobacteria bacterium]|nr:MAG: Gfo/Idh/MocA family oxidoreductase [Actinomycetota bacterium]
MAWEGCHYPRPRLEWSPPRNPGRLRIRRQAALRGVASVGQANPLDDGSEKRLKNGRRFYRDEDVLPRIENGAAGLTSVAVVGLGYWGPNLLRVLFELPDVHVKYACDLDPDRLRKAIRRYPSVEPTTDLERVLDDPEVSAVFIATPVFTHYDLASRALDRGKHTFVEKPLAASSSEADDLIELADSNRLSLMCGHTFIYSPPVQAVKRLIDGGELGEIYFISSSRVNLGLHQREVLARRPARERQRDRTRLGREGNPGRRVRGLELRHGHARARRDELAGAEQAAPNRHRRQREDGRVRRHELGADPRVRLRRGLPGPRELRAVPALVPHRRHPEPAPRDDGAAVHTALGLHRERARREVAH